MLEFDGDALAGVEEDLVVLADGLVLIVFDGLGDGDANQTPWLSGRTMPDLVSRLLSSLRTTTRLPMGSMTSNSARRLVGFVAIFLLYRRIGLGSVVSCPLSVVGCRRVARIAGVAGSQ